MDQCVTGNCIALSKTEHIARLNDVLRTTFEGGKVVITNAVRNLDGFNVRELIAALAGYDGFDADNDPYGERDFGDLELFGESLFWKVDYYDPELKFHSEDPADASVTYRMLTIMLAAEY